MHGTPHTTRTLTAQIGALEIGPRHSGRDATLERAAARLTGPTQHPTLCHHLDEAGADDAWLESCGLWAGTTVPPNCSTVTLAPMLCKHIDDAALEAAAAMTAGSTEINCPRPTVIPLLCRRIDDDGALETAGSAQIGPTAYCTRVVGCKAIDNA